MKQAILFFLGLFNGIIAMETRKKIIDLSEQNNIKMVLTKLNEQEKKLLAEICPNNNNLTTILKQSHDLLKLFKSIYKITINPIKKLERKKNYKYFVKQKEKDIKIFNSKKLFKLFYESIQMEFNELESLSDRRGRKSPEAFKQSIIAKLNAIKILYPKIQWIYNKMNETEKQHFCKLVKNIIKINKTLFNDKDFSKEKKCFIKLIWLEEKVIKALTVKKNPIFNKTKLHNFINIVKNIKMHTLLTKNITIDEFNKKINILIKMIQENN